MDGGACWAPGHRVTESDTIGHAHPHAPVFSFLLVDSVLVSSTESQALQQSGQWPPNSMRGFSQSRSGFLLETQHVNSEPGSVLIWLGWDFRSSGSMSCLCALGSGTGQVFSEWAYHGAKAPEVSGFPYVLCCTLTFFFCALYPNSDGSRACLEKKMAILSSILAWKIPGTGEPGGLQSMGLLRVGYN